MPRAFIGLWVAAAVARGEAAGASAQLDDLDAAPADALADPRPPPDGDDDEDALDPPRPHPRLSREKVLAIERQAVEKRASASHEVMQQFMHNFARNMRYSILADSKGDMPEAERLAMLRQLRESGAVAPDEDPAGPEAAAQEAAAPEAAPRARVRRRGHRLGLPRRPQEAVGMLNARGRSRRAGGASGPGAMPKWRGGHPRHAGDGREHERHFESLFERLDACKTKACVHALWAEASRAPPPGRAARAAARAAAAEGDAAGGEARRGPGLAGRAAAAGRRAEALRREEGPRLLLFGGQAAVEKPKPPREKDAPDALSAGLVGAAIGAVVALAAFLIASWLGP